MWGCGSTLLLLKRDAFSSVSSGKACPTASWELVNSATSTSTPPPLCTESLLSSVCLGYCTKTFIYACFYHKTILIISSRVPVRINWEFELCKFRLSRQYCFQFYIFFNAFDKKEMVALTLKDLCKSFDGASLYIIIQILGYRIMYYGISGNSCKLLFITYQKESNVCQPKV